MRSTHFDSLEPRRLLSNPGVSLSGSPVTITTLANQFVPFTATQIGNNDVLVAYIKSNTAFAVITDNSGNVVVPEFSISTNGQTGDQFAVMAAAQDQNGNAVVIYPVQTQSFAAQLFMARIDSSGHFVDQPVAVASTVAGSQLASAIAIGPNNSVAVVFRVATNPDAVYARVFDSSDNPLFDPIALSVPDPAATAGELMTAPTVIAEPGTSSFLAAWVDEGLANGSSGLADTSESIKDRSFSSTGVLGPDPTIDTEPNTGTTDNTDSSPIFFANGTQPFSAFATSQFSGAPNFTYGGNQIGSLPVNSDGSANGSLAPILTTNSSSQDIPLAVQTIGGNPIMFIGIGSAFSTQLNSVGVAFLNSSGQVIATDTTGTGQQLVKDPIVLPSMFVEPLDGGSGTIEIAEQPFTVNAPTTNSQPVVSIAANGVINGNAHFVITCANPPAQELGVHVDYQVTSTPSGVVTPITADFFLDDQHPSFDLDVPVHQGVAQNQAVNVALTQVSGASVAVDHASVSVPFLPPTVSVSADGISGGIAHFLVTCANPPDQELGVHVDYQITSSPTGAIKPITADFFLDDQQSSITLDVPVNQELFEDATITMTMTEVSGATIAVGTATIDAPSANYGASALFTPAPTGPVSPGEVISGTLIVNQVDPNADDSGTVTGSIEGLGSFSAVVKKQKKPKKKASSSTSQQIKIKLTIPKTASTGAQGLTLAYHPAVADNTLTLNPVLLGSDSSPLTFDVEDIFKNKSPLTLSGQTFSLTGPGQGQLTLNSDGSYDLAFTGTTSATKVTFSGTPIALNNITAGNLGSLTVSGNLDANLAVTSIANLAISGLLGGASADDYREIRATGSIGTVSIGGLRNANLFAGVDSSINILPTGRSAFVASSTIKSFTIKGRSALFSDANVAAMTITSVAVNGLNSTNSTTFGVAADSILKYTRGSVSKKKITTPQIFDTTGQYTAQTL